MWYFSNIISDLSYKKHPLIKCGKNNSTSLIGISFSILECSQIAFLVFLKRSPNLASLISFIFSFGFNFIMAFFAIASIKDLLHSINVSPHWSDCWSMWVKSLSSSCNHWCSEEYWAISSLDFFIIKPTQTSAATSLFSTALLVQFAVQRLQFFGQLQIGN